jgi:AcrR family transcriptional regulator
VSEPAKKQAIFEAALGLFAEKGFHGTTMPDVAEKAAVGAGTVYRYFESKETLVNLLYRHWKLEFSGHVMNDLPVGQPTRALFGVIWRRFCDFARHHPRVVQFLELHHHGDYLDEASVALEEAVLEPILHFVVAAQRELALRDANPRVLIAVVYGAFMGLVRAEMHGHLRISDEVLADAETCVWEAIRR